MSVKMAVNWVLNGLKTLQILLVVKMCRGNSYLLIC